MCVFRRLLIICCVVASTIVTGGFVSAANQPKPATAQSKIEPPKAPTPFQIEVLPVSGPFGAAVKLKAKVTGTVPTTYTMTFRVRGQVVGAVNAGSPSVAPFVELGYTIPPDLHWGNHAVEAEANGVKGIGTLTVQKNKTKLEISGIGSSTGIVPGGAVSANVYLKFEPEGWGYPEGHAIHCFVNNVPIGTVTTSKSSSYSTPVGFAACKYTIPNNVSGDLKFTASFNGDQQAEGTSPASYTHHWPMDATLSSAVMTPSSGVKVGDTVQLKVKACKGNNVACQIGGSGTPAPGLGMQLQWNPQNWFPLNINGVKTADANGIITVPLTVMVPSKKSDPVKKFEWHHATDTPPQDYKLGTTNAKFSIDAERGKAVIKIDAPAEVNRYSTGTVKISIFNTYGTSIGQYDPGEHIVLIKARVWHMQGDLVQAAVKTKAGKGEQKFEFNASAPQHEVVFDAILSGDCCYEDTKTTFSIKLKPL